MSSRSSSDAYTVGLVGAGGIARAHLPAWLALGVDVVVWSTEGAADLVLEHGGTETGSLEELLALCDAVDVCTPTPTHAGLVRRAAAAGRDILCEKPLARTAKEAAALVEECQRAGVQLYPGHVVRYFPEYAALHAAVTSGVLGEIAVQRFSRTGSRPLAPWFSDDDLSGGLVLDQSLHDLDFARWTAGEVVRVFAREVQEAPAGGLRSAQVILTHAAGAISYVTGTWARAGTTFRTRYEVAGTAGVLQHDSREHPPLVVDGGPVRTSGTGLLPDRSHTESPFLTEIREMYAAFRGGPPPRVTAWDGVQAIRLAEAAIESIRSGRAVALEPAGVAARVGGVE